jgi:hypothetical protein
MSRFRKPKKVMVNASDLEEGSKVGLSENLELPQPDLQNPVDSDISMNDITDAMSTLKFVPRSVQLGWRAGRGALAQQ